MLGISREKYFELEQSITFGIQGLDYHTSTATASGLVLCRRIESTSSIATGLMSASALILAVLERVSTRPQIY